jgi:DNA-3-methyladenine glycosylase
MREVKLRRKFLQKDADVVAKKLLGKKLIRVFEDGTKKEGIISETEAYLGIKDKACHSYGGRRTKRTSVMYRKAGTIYVYFTYGMHWMLNIICANVNDPQAVLIRGLDVVSGPARLTKLFEIIKTFNGQDIINNQMLYIEDTGIKYSNNQIENTKRIGVDYAGEWKDKLLRFVLRPT